jgi:transglutaminase-like putative cysteine protease
VPVRFSIDCRLDYSVFSQSEFIFNVEAAASESQVLASERFSITGARSVEAFKQGDMGSRFVRASAGPGHLTLDYSTELTVDHTCAPPSSLMEHTVAELPPQVLAYVLPSRYCESDRLVHLAVSKFGTLQPGYSRVQAVCDWVTSHVRFAPGTTNSCTSASEVLVQGRGVCRDFAHLTIALLRALNIPARFVTGYDYGVDPSFGPTDFHAYVEVFLSGRWWIFDATRLCPRNGLVRIGTGRDAADVAFATIFGAIRFEGMRLDIRPLDMEVMDPVGVALSTAGLQDASNIQPEQKGPACRLAA